MDRSLASRKARSSFRTISARLAAVGRPLIPVKAVRWIIHTRGWNYNNEVEKDYWSTREGEYGNVAVGVDASKLGGPDDNSFGVICRYRDAENFYAFLVSSDGYYGIIKLKDGNYSLLSGKNMDFNSGITRGRGTNRILGICSEDELGLYVNGSLLTIVQDSDFTDGRIGLISGSNATPGTDILFDNLILYQQ